MCEAAARESSTIGCTRMHAYREDEGGPRTGARCEYMRGACLERVLITFLHILKIGKLVNLSWFVYTTEDCHLRIVGCGSVHSIFSHTRLTLRSSLLAVLY